MEYHSFKSTRTYVLDANKNIVAQPDMLKWSQWRAAAEKLNEHIVKQTTLGDTHISTVFLGIDHNHYRDREPVLFETGVFRDGHEDRYYRYRSWSDAVTGHDLLVDIVTRGWPQL